MKILTTSILLMTGLSFAQINLSSGLTGYFPLDGDGVDNSTTAIDATNNGASSTADASGNPGSALHLNAIESDYLNAGNNSRGITDKMSVSFWFRTTSSATQHLVEKYNWTMDAGFYIRLQGGKICFHGRDGSGVGIAPPLSAQTYNDGDWHHVMAILDQNDWLLYVDCELVQSHTTSSSSPDISVNWPLTFGRYTLDNMYYFDGDLDEVRIYDRVLNSDEICFLCGSGFDATNQLVGQFNLDGNADDQSLWALDGTNFGAAPVDGFESVPGSALRFISSESDYVDAGTDSRGISDQMTVSFWFKTSSSGTHHLIEKYNWTMDAGFYIRLQGGKICFHGRDGSGLGIAPPLSAQTYNDNQWHHVLAKLDVNSWRLFVDCELVQDFTTATVSPDIAVNWPLTFGRYTLDDTYYFEGEMDEVLIYNRPLSDAEICQLCNNNVNLGTEDARVAVVETIQLFPNPASELVTIAGADWSALESGYEIQVFDLTGQQIMRQANCSSIDVSGFAAGVYFLNVCSENGLVVYTAKFVKSE